MTKKQDKQKRKHFSPLNYPFNGILERYHTSKFLLPNSIRACNAKPAKWDIFKRTVEPLKHPPPQTLSPDFGRFRDFCKLHTAP